MNRIFSTALLNKFYILLCVCTFYMFSLVLLYSVHTLCLIFTITLANIDQSHISDIVAFGNQLQRNMSPHLKSIVLHYLSKFGTVNMQMHCVWFISIVLCHHYNC